MCSADLPTASMADADRWRLARSEFADGLDGEGARLFGGRWNSRGRSALYTSSHLSLSVLEVYVHIPPDLRDDLPILQAVQIFDSRRRRRRRTFRKSNSITLLESADPMAACRAMGDGWLDRNAELVLEVPSILVPEETNLILNPAHPRMREVEIVSSRAFRSTHALRSRRRRLATTARAVPTSPAGSARRSGSENACTFMWSAVVWHLNENWYHWPLLLNAPPLPLIVLLTTFGVSSAPTMLRSGR